MPKIKHASLPTLGDIAKTLGGEMHGNAEEKVKGLCPADEPTSGYLAFLNSLNRKIEKSVDSLTCLAGLIIPKQETIPEYLKDFNLILVDNPAASMLEVIPLFFTPRNLSEGIHSSCVIDASASIGEGVTIGAFCSVGAEVSIGDRVVIHPHVTIYPGASIGADSVIHSGAVLREDLSIAEHSVIQNGAVIGSDGFGYIPDPTLGLRHVPQIGSVELSARVEVGANSCIDRAALGTTRIGVGTKIDNLVQVGHNTQIGEYCILCGQVGIGGSSKIGNQVVLGGMSGVADHITITDNARFAGKAGAITNIPESGDYAGLPAIPASTWKRASALFRKLPQLAKKIDSKGKRS